jgi:hypothetical protein
MQSPLALSSRLVSSWGAVERMDSALDFLQRFSGIFLPSQGSSYLNDVSLWTRRHRCRLALYQIKIPKEDSMKKLFNALNGPANRRSFMKKGLAAAGHILTSGRLSFTAA